jgi:hypothetical protein
MQETYMNLNLNYTSPDYCFQINNNPVLERKISGTVHALDIRAGEFIKPQAEAAFIFNMLLQKPAVLHAKNRVMQPVN